MVALPQVYNTADLPDTGGGVVLIPPGQYQAVIVDSELKSTANGQGQFLALKIVVTQGAHANTEFIERLNIINANQTAVEIAYKTLARISEAVGMTTTPADSTMLHNKPLMIEIATEEGKPWKDKEGVERQGKPKSVIKKYHKLPAVGVAGAPPFGAQAAAPSAPATPPWAKK